jgi:hypothetical protein
MRNLHYGSHDDHKGCYLSPKGSSPKVFGDVVHDAHFPQCFRAPNNITRYDSKTIPSVWLEDYRLACRVGG